VTAGASYIPSVRAAQWFEHWYEKFDCYIADELFCSRLKSSAAGSRKIRKVEMPID
jgi:hypothetical protein